jgi:hypothetical protein
MKINFKLRPYGCILWFAVFTHMLWGILLLFDPRAEWVTALSFTASLIPGDAVEPWLYISVSVLSAVSLLRNKIDLTDLSIMIPQQFILYLSAGGAIKAIMSSSFADGVVRPWAFIAADQSPYIFMAIIHTMAMIYPYIKFNKRGFAL